MFAQLSAQFTRFWSNQSKAQRIVLVALVTTGFILIPIFLAWASTPSYAVAFSGLSEADAGQIVEKLNEENIPYQLRGSGTIMVPSDQVYDVRLKMARQGLPQGGTVGFELFNGNTLGMTEFTQRVNYQQAMEGELERTIGSLNAVEAVRVHIVTPEKSLLAHEQAPTTASVTVKERPGTRLDAAQVRSITHLVASSVEGLQPENVVVVDVSGNLLAAGETSGASAGLAQLDTRRAAEVQTARDLQLKVQDLLNSVLGPNKSVVQANVMMDWTERETTTQSYDPGSVTVRSSQDVTEVYTTTNSTLMGVPGAVSNLPPAEEGVAPENQGVAYKRTEHLTNYEITEVQSYEVEAPGEIERVSLSVLVDGLADQAQLATLESAIAAAAGIDPTRGDLLVVETLEFDRSFYEAQAADLESSQKRDLYIRIAEVVAIGLLLVGLLWYVQRLLSNLRLASTDAWQPVLKPLAEMALPSGAGYQPQAQAASKGGRSAMSASPREQQTAPELSSPRAVERPKPKPVPKYEIPSISAEEEQLLSLVKGLSDEEPASLANIIQLWLSEDEKGNE